MDNALSASSVVDYVEHGNRAGTYDRATRHLLRSVGRTQLPSNVRLCCYFQSWRYFDQFADRVRLNFRFREPIAAEAVPSLRQILHGSGTPRVSAFTSVAPITRADTPCLRRTTFGRPCGTLRNVIVMLSLSCAAMTSGGVVTISPQPLIPAPPHR